MHSLNENLSDKVANLIRQAILTGELKAGSKIPQDELAETFGVSRMPVREALVILNYEGLVNIEPRRGAWVAFMTLATVDESYAMRQWAESQAVSLSVPRLTADDLSLAQEELERMEVAENTSDATTFILSNTKFHHVLRSRCPWPKLSGLVDTLWKGFPPLSPQFMPQQMARDRDEHRQLLHAALEHRSKDAQQLMVQHIQRSWAMARNHFQTLGWTDGPTETDGDAGAMR